MGLLLNECVFTPDSRRCLFDFCENFRCELFVDDAFDVSGASISFFLQTNLFSFTTTIVLHHYRTLWSLFYHLFSSKISH